MKKNIIVNADDGGISVGVNTAIKQMIIDGNLNSVSVFANGQYTLDIVDFCKNHKVNVGLHFNLTTGKSIAGNTFLPNITKPNGEFKYGFFMLSILSLLRRKVILKEIEVELIAQIKYFQTHSIKLKHINGHRHIHVIPNVFNFVTKYAKINQIEHIRIINESFFNTFFTTKNISCLYNGNFIKWMILRTFNMFNEPTKSNTYFFSILHTCKITNDVIKKIRIPRGFTGVEIMLHPGNSQIDSKNQTLRYETEHLTSPNRDLEANFRFPQNLIKENH